jgi:hypothetical protein
MAASSAARDRRINGFGAGGCTEADRANVSDVGEARHTVEQKGFQFRA